MDRETSNGPPGSYCFEGFEIDLPSRSLLRGGRPVAVEPRVFDVLLYLLEHRDRMVEKEELVEAVWERAFVTENALSRAIARLRKTLDDDSQEPRFIETVRGRGYRFVAPVVVETGPDPLARGESPARRATTGSKIGPLGVRTVLLAALGLLIVLLTLATMLDRRSPEPPPADTPQIALPLRQLTSSRSVEAWPSLSPDGSAVVYAAERDGELGLYVRALTPGARENPLLPPGETGWQPAWSPDGQTVAYASQGAVWLVPALGGTPRKLTDFGRAPAWFPDGESLVIQDGYSGSYPDSPPATLPSSLWRVPIDGGSAVRLTEPGQPPGGHGAPVVSPDGRRVAFTSYVQSFGTLWTVSRSGDDPQQVNGVLQPGRPRYAPDGRGLYFTVAQRDAYGLWYVPLAVDGRRAAGRPVRLVEDRLRHVSVSLDGRRVAFSLLDLDSNLRSTAVDPSRLVATAPPLSLTDETNFRTSMPVFSGDGRRLVYRVAPGGRPSELWLLDLEAGRRSLLVGGSGLVAATLPSWLEGGDRVAYRALDLETREDLLLTVDVASRRVEELGRVGPSWQWPRLSPDGRRVAFHREIDGTTNVWVADLDGGSPRQLTFVETFAGYPAWSPDGSRIAVEVRDDEGLQVAVVKAGGGAPTLLTSGPGLRWVWTWSPAGGHLAIAEALHDRWALIALSLDGGESSRLAESETLDYIRSPAWSPLGDQIVYEYGRVTGDIYVADLPAASGR